MKAALYGFAACVFIVLGLIVLNAINIAPGGMNEANMNRGFFCYLCSGGLVVVVAMLTIFKR